MRTTHRRASSALRTTVRRSGTVRRAAASTEIELDLAEGPPAEAVNRAAMVRDADEIVVGSRGLGRFRGAIGSVSHALLHEADRPVVVVPLSRAD